MLCRNTLWIAVTVALSLLAFFGGRQLNERSPLPTDSGSDEATHLSKRSETLDSQPGTSGEMPAQSRVADRRPRPRLARSHDLVGRPIAPEWRQLVERDPQGARHLHQTILRTIEARRRESGGGRKCMSGDEVGSTFLAFWVFVDATPDALRIGETTFNHVTEGVVLPKATTDCLAALLSKDEIVESDGRIPTYRGQVEYRIPFDFTSSAQ